MRSSLCVPTAMLSTAMKRSFCADRGKGLALENAYLANPCDLLFCLLISVFARLFSACMVPLRYTMPFAI